AVKLADYDGTGGAIGCGAAFLGSGAAQILAQKLKDRAGRVDGVERDDLAVEREANRRAAGRRLRLLPRHRKTLNCRDMWNNSRATSAAARGNARPRWRRRIAARRRRQKEDSKV